MPLGSVPIFRSVLNDKAKTSNLKRRCSLEAAPSFPWACGSSAKTPREADSLNFFASRLPTSVHSSVSHRSKQSSGTDPQDQSFRWRPLAVTRRGRQEVGGTPAEAHDASLETSENFMNQVKPSNVADGERVRGVCEPGCIVSHRLTEKRGKPANFTPSLRVVIWSRLLSACEYSKPSRRTCHWREFMETGCRKEVCVAKC